MRIVILLLVVALSGCAGSEPSGPTVEPVTAGDAPVNGTVSPEEPANATVENLVPVFDLGVDVVNGTAPLLVNFTLDGEDDSENLSWAFYVEDNLTLEGREFPTVFNHTFDAGIWNVSVILTDGEHAATRDATIEAVDGALQEIGRFEGTARITLFTHRGADYAVECPGFVAGEEDVGCFWAELPDGIAGQPAMFTTTAASTRLAFWDSCDAVDGTGVGWFEEGNPLELVVPDGAGCVVAWSANTGDVGQEREFSLVVYG